MNFYIPLILWIAAGFWFGRGATLCVIAHRKAITARRDMLNAMTWTPIVSDPEWSEWPRGYGATHLENVKTARKKRQANKAKEYARARQDRRRAFAWPIFELRRHRDRNKQANDILHAVIAEQTMQALDDLKRQTGKP